MNFFTNAIGGRTSAEEVNNELESLKSVYSKMSTDSLVNLVRDLQGNGVYYESECRLAQIALNERNN